MKAIENEQKLYQLRDEPYSYRIGVFDLVEPLDKTKFHNSTTQDRTRDSGRIPQHKRLNSFKDVLLSSAVFWVVQLVGVASLIIGEFVSVHKEVAKNYLNLSGLTLVVLATGAYLLRVHRITQLRSDAAAD